MEIYPFIPQSSESIQKKLHKLEIFRFFPKDIAYFKTKGQLLCIKESPLYFEAKKKGLRGTLQSETLEKQAKMCYKKMLGFFSRIFQK